MEKMSARGRLRSNRYTPAASQRAIHFASSPSKAGFSGSGTRRSYTEIGDLANWRVGDSRRGRANAQPIRQFASSPSRQLLERGSYLFDSIAATAFGGFG